MSESTSLDNQVVLVTGAASGIGRQIAIDLCSRKARVATCDLSLIHISEPTRRS